VFVNQRGNVVTYVIVAMTMAATLAVGMVYMSSSSTFGLGEITANNSNRAYLLAQAGKDYALLKWSMGDTAGTNFTFANGDLFQLVISGNNIQSTGIISQGTPFEARRKITITKP
jgi:hypothetical protein